MTRSQLLAWFLDVKYATVREVEGVFGTEGMEAMRCLVDLGIIRDRYLGQKLVYEVTESELFTG